MCRVPPLTGGAGLWATEQLLDAAVTWSAGPIMRHGFVFVLLRRRVLQVAK